MNFTTIHLAYDSGVATITLNRPEKRNAISFELIDDLLRALDEFPQLNDGFEVVDGQQRLTAIYEFFGDELELSADSATDAHCSDVGNISA